MNNIINDKLDEVQNKYNKLINELIKKNISISTMESCTGGFIASLITDTEGASDIFKGSLVTYSNEAKIRAGVSRDIIAKYGVYSNETAKAMAGSVRDYYKSKIGIGITGSIGCIDPNNIDSVPNEIYIGVTYEGKDNVYSLSLINVIERFHGKLMIAEQLCDIINLLIN